MPLQVINHDFSSDVDRLKLLVLSDLHIEDPLCDRRRAVQFVEEVKNDQNCYFGVNGDMFNNAVRTAVSDTWENTMTIDTAIDTICEMLDPIREKCLFITDGNHEKRSYKDHNRLLLKDVSRILGIRDRYSFDPYLVYIAFGKNQGRECRKTVYSIYGKHGTGGGRTMGAKMNKLEQMLNVINADIFIHSHTHVQAAFRLRSASVDYRNRKPNYKEHLFVNSNAYLDFGGYGEDQGYRPVSTVYPIIYLEGTERAARALI